MYSAALGAAYSLGGIVTGYAVADALGAVPTKVAAPAISNAAAPKATVDGKAVTGQPTARQSLFTSALLVVGAIVILLFGNRFLKDARIG